MTAPRPIPEAVRKIVRRFKLHYTADTPMLAAAILALVDAERDKARAEERERCATTPGLPYEWRDKIREGK